MAELPVPEPTAKDEELAMAFMELRSATNLRGVPDGRQRCDNCHFYLEPDRGVSYCWHEKLEIEVGAQWWCDRWEEIGASDQQPTERDRQVGLRLRFELVEDNQWLHEPKFGEQCSTCLFYLEPDETVSYCWHPKLQVGVGEDHWCTWWEQTLDE